MNIYAFLCIERLAGSRLVRPSPKTQIRAKTCQKISMYIKSLGDFLKINDGFTYTLSINYNM